MKKILLIGLFTSVLSLISCGGDEDGGGNSTASIVLSADETNSYIGDPVTFKVVTDKGTDVSDMSTYYVDGVEIADKVHTSNTVGSYTVYATYTKNGNIITSPTITINIANAIKFNKKVLIEDFTGTWCGYCPRVAYAVDQANTRTTDAVVVAIHRGNDPYNFDGASALETQIGLTGYPTAMLNRKTEWKYPETSTTSINQAVNLTTGVNPKLGISLETTTSGNTSSVEVNVKFGRNFSNLKVVVYAVENGLIYNQTNYTSYYGGTSTISNFEHNHVLRAVLSSSILGEPITGSTNYDEEFTRTFNYTIPNNVNSANLKFVAFVLDSSNNAINSREAGPNEVQVYEIE